MPVPVENENLVATPKLNHSLKQHEAGHQHEHRVNAHAASVCEPACSDLDSP
jgi:hypothetical protein